MKWPKISVITASYNQGKFIEETILSVIGQEYDNLEYLVIDGGSTDESVDIIRKYEKHIHYWVSEKDKGQSDAINKGISRSTGEIFTWINSDDLLLPGTLKSVALQFSKLPDQIGVIHGGTILFEKEKDIKTIFTYGQPTPEKYLASMAFSQPAAFIRKSYADRVGYLAEGLHYGMDYDLFARLACISEFSRNSEIYSKYRLHDESKSVAHHDKFRKDWELVFFSICNHIGWHDVITDIRTNFRQVNVPDNLLAYNFAADERIIQKFNKEKVIFYFLEDILLDYYWNDKRAEARNLLSQLKTRFPADWIQEDERVMAVVKKLAIPEPVLAVLKSVKKLIK